VTSASLLEAPLNDEYQREHRRALNALEKIPAGDPS